MNNCPDCVTLNCVYEKSLEVCICGHGKAWHTRNNLACDYPNHPERKIERNCNCVNFTLKEYINKCGLHDADGIYIGRMKRRILSEDKIKQKHCMICGSEPRHHYANEARSCLNKINLRLIEVET